jgi:transcriptional regulator with XRE-family HTH domain
VDSDFSEIFQSLRKELGYNQETMAKELGVAQSTIAMWETGQRLPSPELYKQIADYFDVSIDYLYGRNVADNKNIIAQNIQYYMDINNKERKQVCDALGVKYTTFTDWIKGNSYPRIDKIELLANYFGITKSDLIEEHRQGNVTLGDIIKAYRVENSMSMDTFADRSGISKAYISLLEKNEHPKTGKTIAPSVQCIKQAADGMDMDFDELFTLVKGSIVSDTSDRIKQAMDYRNVTQADIVQMTGINKGSISSYIAGRYLPKPDNLYRIAQALSVNPEWLMGANVPMVTGDSSGASCSDMSNTEKTCTQFSANLNRLLKQNNMTQAELASRMDVSTATVSAWCTAIKVPRMSKLDRICNIFHCSQSELLDEREVSKDKIDMCLTLYEKLNEAEKVVFKRIILKEDL